MIEKSVKLVFFCNVVLFFHLLLILLLLKGFLQLMRPYFTKLLSPLTVMSPSLHRLIHFSLYEFHGLRLFRLPKGINVIRTLYHIFVKLSLPTSFFSYRRFQPAIVLHRLYASRLSSWACQLARETSARHS